MSRVSINYCAQNVCWLLGFLLLASPSTLPLAAAEPLVLALTTDRPDAMYAAGEEAVFVVMVTRGEQPAAAGAVRYVVDDFIDRGAQSNEFPRGELTLQDGRGSISFKSRKPGFVRCRVTLQTPGKKPLRAIASAAFSPLDIPPSLPAPDDFDAFWNDQKKQLAAMPFTPKLTPVPQGDASIQCFDVQAECLGGAPVSGYFGLPADAKPKSLPAILWVHGAGVRSSSLANAIKGAKAGMLSLDINAHGLPNGKPADFYKAQSAGPLKNYRHAGRESRDTSYFRGMFLRIVRAIDFLTSRPEWDGQVVAVVGHSQGGGQALVAGGLDARVTFIGAGVPAICDHSGRAAGRINGWPKLTPTGADGKPDARILQASRYVDAVNFASRCKADAIMSVGFIDPVCPPSSCYAAYNQLLGEKTIINRPLMSHAAPASIQQAFFAAILKHIEP